MEYKSKVDIVYERIIQGLHDGTYKNGDRLVISRIAAQNEVSDIPTREAIRRLESEGYVTIRANQGAVVNIMEKEDVMEIFQIKSVLEGYAARIAIPYLNEEDYRNLRNINRQMELSQNEKTGGKTVDLNMQFLLYMYERIPQKKLLAMIQDLWKKWSMTKAVFSLAPERSLDSVKEHEEILKLMEQKLPDEVEQAVREHKVKAGFELVKKINR